MLRSLTSMSFQYARNANPESFLTNWLHWLSDMFVTVRIGKIFWLMSLRKQSFFSNLCTVWLCESLHSVTVWVMREVIGNGWERRSGQKRELRANERSPKTGNRPKMGKLQNQVEKSDFVIFLCPRRGVVMIKWWCNKIVDFQQLAFCWWILLTFCTEISFSSQIVVEWIIVQLIWLFVVYNFVKWYFFSLPQQGQISWGHLFNPYPPHISALKCL